MELCAANLSSKRDMVTFRGKKQNNAAMPFMFINDWKRDSCNKKQNVDSDIEILIGISIQ